MKTLLQMLLAILIGTPGALLVLSDGMPSVSVMSHREWYDGEISIIYPGDIGVEDWDGYLSNVTENTGVTFDAVPAGWGDYLPKVYTMAAAGDLTDVVYADAGMARRLGDMGMLAPLNDTVITADMQDEFYPAAFSEAIPGDDNIYVAPARLMTYKMWVNQAALEEMGLEAPANVDEMMEALLYCYSAGYYMPYVSAWEPYSVLDDMALYVRLFDGDFMDWTHPGNIQAMEFMYNMVYGSYGASPELLYYNYSMSRELLEGGQSVFSMSWDDGAYYEAAGLYGDGGVVMHSLTSLDGSRESIAQSTGFAMNVYTEEEAAAGFLRYAASRQGAVDAYTYLGWYPVRADAWEDEELELGEFQLDYQAYLEDTVHYPLPALYSDDSFRGMIGELFTEYIYSGFTPEELCYMIQDIMEGEFSY